MQQTRVSEMYRIIRTQHVVTTKCLLTTSLPSYLKPLRVALGSHSHLKFRLLSPLFVNVMPHAGTSLEASYPQSTAAYIASHHRLINLTFKRVVVVMPSTEMGRNNYESLYFIL